MSDDDQKSACIRTGGELAGEGVPSNGNNKNEQGAYGRAVSAPDGNPPETTPPSKGDGGGGMSASTSSSSMEYLHPSIDYDEVLLEEQVGQGSYGVVFKGIWRNRPVAVKRFQRPEEKNIETEVRQLSRVNHTNIIKLFGLSSKGDFKFLIMEYAEGGSLFNFLHGTTKPFYSTAHAMSWAHQCAEGIAYLHAMKPKALVHRDLKPLNLLLTNKGRNLKICDFGTVADISTKMTNNKGSAAWMAPEVFAGDKYNEKCDIYSWGIVLWEILTRQQPYKNYDNMCTILYKVHKGERPPINSDIPEPLKILMHCCWDRSENRPSMEKIVKVMKQLVLSFPGSDTPLEYEFIQQKIVCTTPSYNKPLDFSTFNTSDFDSNILSILEPPPNMPRAEITASMRWDHISDKSDSTPVYSWQNDTNDSHDIFNLTPSAESVKRYETILNGMTQMANVPMLPLSVDVDPNAWDLDPDVACSIAKSDGKERLTVTDAKPLMPNGTMADKLIENRGLNDNAEDDEEEEEEIDGTVMLEPELQPEQPIPNNRESQEIYRDHRRLAKEYLRVESELYFAEVSKKKILEQMEPKERKQKEELLKKMSEKEELLALLQNLKLQFAQTNSGADPDCSATGSTSGDDRTATTTEGNFADDSSDGDVAAVPSELVADDGWVVVPPNRNA